MADPSRSPLKLVVVTVSLVLPRRLRRALLNLLPGYDIHPTARIGRSVVLAEQFVMGAGASIGHLNLIKDVRRLRMGDGCRIDNGNHLFGTLGTNVDWPRTLDLGAGAHVTSRHFIDVAGTIAIGPGVRIGGRGTQIWAHTFHGSSEDRRIRFLDVEIGEETFIGAASVLVGCRIPAGSKLAAGTVFTGRLEGGSVAMHGNPAVVRQLEQQS